MGQIKVIRDLEVKKVKLQILVIGSYYTWFVGHIFVEKAKNDPKTLLFPSRSDKNVKIENHRNS